MDSPSETQSLRIVSGLNRPIKRKPMGEQPRAIRRQEFMVVLANLGVLATGLALGMPTVTLKQLTDPNGSVHMSTSQASWFASLNSLSSPLGGFLQCFILDRYGRKNTLYFANFFAILSWSLMVFSTYDDSTYVYIQLLFSRFIIGITSGLSSAPAGVYSAEIGLPKIRGRLILGTSVAVAAGITFVYVLGFFIRDDWRLLSMIILFYQIFAVLCIIPMPETPSWLLSKGRYVEAKQSLNYFRGLKKSDTRTYDEIETEFNLLQKSIQLRSGAKNPSFLKSLHLPEVYKPFLIMIGLFACQQFTGIFVIIVYAVQIAIDAGVRIDPFMCAILIGLARLLTTCPVGLILEKWGRRRAGMFSAFGMGICMTILAAKHYVTWLDIPYLPLLSIVSFIVISTIGIYTLPFFMISEVFPQKVRGAAAGLTIASGLLMAFITIKTYPSLKSAIGNESCFALYAVMSFLSVLYVYIFLPETKGKTLLEIEEEFRFSSKTNGVRLRNKDANDGLNEVFVRK